MASNVIFRGLCDDTVTFSSIQEPSSFSALGDRKTLNSIRSSVIGTSASREHLMFHDPWRNGIHCSMGRGIVLTL